MVAGGDFGGLDSHSVFAAVAVVAWPVLASTLKQASLEPDVTISGGGAAPPMYHQRER